MNRTASAGIWVNGAVLITILAFHLVFLRHPWAPQDAVAGSLGVGSWNVLMGLPPFVHLIVFWGLSFANHIIIKRTLPNAVDDYIFPLFVLLTGISLVLLAGLSPNLQNERSFYLAQFGHWLLAAVTIPFAAILFGCSNTWNNLYRFFRHHYHWLAVAAIILLLLTVIFGKEINNRRLWLQAFGFSFQPIEFTKVLMVLFTAAVLQRSGEDMHDYRSLGTSFGRWCSRFIAWFYPWPLIFMILLGMKDLGPLMILAIFSATCFIIAGLRFEFSLAALLLGAAVACFSFTYRWPHSVWQRIEACMDPFSVNPMVWKSIVSVASGGLNGKGLGGADTAVNIPYVTSDYIFTLAAEQIGLIGITLILFVYLLFTLRAFWIAYSLPGTYEKLLAFGIGLMVSLNFLISAFGNLGAIPQTGIVIPYLSFGGSSLIANSIMCGILLGISAKRRNEYENPSPTISE